jgi:uncharacterized protein (DUF305 family)
MPRPHLFLAAAGAALLTACGAARAPQNAPSPKVPYQMGLEAARTRAAQDSARYPYTQADIDFMSGMIHHHAQAILMSKWAPSHGASAELLRLTGRIINAQTDEIALMQAWLDERKQPVPRVDSTGHVVMDHAMHGMHQMMMPGMLTAEQLDSLDAARSERFDVLFLQYMIQHHRGAVSMVKTLFEHHGAGQNEAIFKFAADVEVDQSTEIRRMMQMLLQRGAMPASP